MERVKLEEKDGWYITYVYHPDSEVYVPVIRTKDKSQAKILFDIYS